MKFVYEEVARTFVKVECGVWGEALLLDCKSRFVLKINEIHAWYYAHKSHARFSCVEEVICSSAILRGRGADRVSVTG
jgi:hypothetical protein